MTESDFLKDPYGFNEIYLELHGQNRLYIENFKKLLKYTPIEIYIQSNQGSLLISGRNLYIKRYTSEELVIEGIIQNIFQLT